MGSSGFLSETAKKENQHPNPQKNKTILFNISVGDRL